MSEYIIVALFLELTGFIHEYLIAQSKQLVSSIYLWFLAIEILSVPYLFGCAESLDEFKP